MIYYIVSYIFPVVDATLMRVYIGCSGMELDGRSGD